MSSNTLVRFEKKSRPVGTIVDIYAGRDPIKVGDELEVIAAADNETLNIAKVTNVYQKDGDTYMTLEMIA